MVTIVLPPLRERREDIPLLIDHFLTIRQFGKVKHQVSPDAMQAMLNYAWPGNVRELANVLERAQILSEDETITIDDLPENMIVHPVRPTEIARQTGSAEPAIQLEAVERNHVLKMLEQFKFNKVHVAKALGISRRSLYRLIDKYQLEPAKPEGS